MRNPFVIIGILVIGVGIFCVGMALGLLGYDHIHLRLITGMVGLVAIVMGLFLIQLMKDDSLYQESSDYISSKESGKQ